MTVREMMEIIRNDENDVDFIDNYDESAYLAYCGTELTEEGEKHFDLALNLIVSEKASIYHGVFNDNFVKNWGEQIVVECSTDKEVRALSDLLYSMAGYCSLDDYEKWFKDEE